MKSMHRHRPSRPPFLAMSILFLAGLSLAVAGPLVPGSGKSASGYVPDEVLVRFRAGTAPAQRQQAAGAVGIRFVSLAPDVQRVRLKAGETVASAVARLAADPAVAHVQPNYRYHAALVPSDSDYGQLWGLNNTGQTITGAVYGTANPGVAGRDIAAEGAWDIATDCRDAIVAVLDTGIDYTHPDLAANMWDGGAAYPNHGWDFVLAGDNDPRPVGGGEHHGTHVAGIIAAVGNNARGATGVCWQARVMAVRVLNANGIGTTADIIEGIRFAVDRGAKVINMSLAGEGPYDTLYANAIDYARQRDVLVVTAAGNEGVDVRLGSDGNSGTWIYPCAFPHENLICVGALDQAYDIASFSNFGTVDVDLGAPGTNVRSSLPGQVHVDDFSGWTADPATGWSSTSCDLGYGPMNMLVNPDNWCPPLNTLPSNPYAADANDVIYRIFDLGNGVVAASLSYYAFMDVASGDTFASAYDAFGNNPFAGSGSFLQAPLDGSSLPNSFYFEHELGNCLTSNCAIGFRLQGNGDATTATGMSIYYLELKTLEPGSDYYGNSNGTSMASPYVAGIAALVRAFNPDYTFTDTVKALIEGGDAAVGTFVGRSRTDRTANAEGALRYLAPPENLTVSVR